MNIITNRQVNIDLFPHGKGFHFQHEGQDYVFPSMDKVHAFFQKQSFNTLKLCHEGKRGYVHFGLDDVEVFDSKWALRNALSYESGGAWVEEKEGRKHFFVDESGWFNTSYKQVSKEEFLQRLESLSTMQKVLGIGLGILALLPGALEIKARLPFGASEAGMSLLALQQKSPLLGALGYSLLPSSINAQAVGTEFQVNNYTTNNQHFPAIATLNDDGFVVTWQSSDQDGDSTGIFAQRYNSSGTIVGSEFQINSYTLNSQVNSVIAPLADGGFVIAWQSFGQDGDKSGIFAQRYDSNGAPSGSEFQVNNYTTSDQQDPAIAPLIDGGFVISWASVGQDGDLDGIFAQRYDSLGAALDPEFQVNTYTTSDQWFPAIAALSDGGFVITWQSNGQDGDEWGIYGQRYDSTGARNGSEFQVNTYTTNWQFDSAIAPLNDGGFVVTWMSNGQDGDGWGIFGQRYDSNSAPIGSEFQINTYTTLFQWSANIAALSDGGFVVTWSSDSQDGDGYGIYGQRYNSSNAKVGSEFQINTYTTSNQDYCSVAALSDGGFVVTWTSGDISGSGQDGSGTGVFGQRYDQNGNAVPLTNLPLMSSVSALNSHSETASSMQSDTSSPIASSTSVPPTTDLRASPSPSILIGLSSIPNTLNSPSGLSGTSTLLNNSPSPSLASSGASTNSISLPSNIVGSSGFVIPSIVDIVYDENYLVHTNGQTIGTYTISGGTGLLDSGNTNAITLYFNLGYQPEEGDIVTLFEIPQGQESEWQSFEEVVVANDDFECLEARGEVGTGSPGSSFQIIFEGVSPCATAAPKILARVLPMAIN